MRRITKCLGLTAAVMGLVAGTGAEAGLVVSLEAPGVQASTVPGVTTETFDSFITGNRSSLNTAVGTITSMGAGQFDIVPANVFGGAGGAGNFFTVSGFSGSAAPATLVLNTPQAYFGFWWSAADQFNQVSFFSGSQLLGSLNTPFILSTLASLPNGGQYFGNPNGGDASEPFVYLDVTATGGTKITSLVFANSGSLASGFESDNWSFTPTAPTTVPGTIIPGGIVGVPEPSSLIHAAVACILGGLATFRWRRYAARNEFRNEQ